MFSAGCRASARHPRTLDGTHLAPCSHGPAPQRVTVTTMPATAHRRRVLVVDDEPYIGRIIQLKLEGGAYDVELVHDGRVALDLLRQDGPIDLILLDIMMPHMSGFDVLAELRRLPHRTDTPVIMLTAKGQETDRERAAALGASDFLTKPFSPKKLLARIDEIFAA
jgi:DNA-binding response OmpR family regulator